MDAGPDFEELKRLDPELANLEQRARDVRDPGGELFCANHAWFEIKDALRQRAGAWRGRRAGEPPEAAEALGRVEAFEVAFAALYPLLPPCRACGCQLFEPYREEDLAACEETRRAGGKAPRPEREGGVGTGGSRAG